MSIPANYTVDSFSDWLKDHVLIDTAQELGWIDNPAAKTGYTANFTMATTSNAGTNTLTVVPLQDYLKSGKTLHYGGYTGVASTNYPAGSTTIVLTGTHLGQWTAGTSGTFDVDSTTRVINPIYASIINETLARMGVDDITTLTTPAQIRKLRIFGRREVWRMAMQYLASDYDYNSGAEQVLRSQVYEHARILFEQENLRVRHLYTDAEKRGTLQGELPVHVSKSAKMIIRW